MEDSILNTIKPMLDVDVNCTNFDISIITDINTVLLSINQLDIGPKDGFSISDATAKWSDLFGTRKDLEAVKTYIYLKVKLLFDPPSNSFLIASIEREIDRLEFRLLHQAESTDASLVPTTTQVTNTEEGYVYGQW